MDGGDNGSTMGDSTVDGGRRSSSIRGGTDLGSSDAGGTIPRKRKTEPAMSEISNTDGVETSPSEVADQVEGGTGLAFGMLADEDAATNAESRNDGHDQPQQHAFGPPVFGGGLMREGITTLNSIPTEETAKAEEGEIDDEEINEDEEMVGSREDGGLSTAGNGFKSLKSDTTQYDDLMSGAERGKLSSTSDTNRQEKSGYFESLSFERLTD